MFLQIDVPDQPSRRVRLTRRTVVIGRDAASDLRIEHADVPPFLCRIEAAAHHRWILRSLMPGSSPATTGMQLEPGQSVIVGPVRLRLQSSAPPVRTCPVCGSRMQQRAVLCIHCGYDQRTGRRVDDRPMPFDLTPPLLDVPPAAAPTWTAARADPQADDPARDAGRRAVVVPWRECGAVNTAIAAGLALMLIHFVVFPPEKPIVFALGWFLTLFFNTAILVAAVLIASHWGILEFGEVDRAVLRCAAVQIATMAALAWLPTEAALLRWSPSMVYFGPFVTHVPRLLVSALLPFLLMRYFFELDMYEAFMLGLSVGVVSYFLMLLMIVLV